MNPRNCVDAASGGAEPCRLTFGMVRNQPWLKHKAIAEKNKMHIRKLELRINACVPDVVRSSAIYYVCQSAPCFVTSADLPREAKCI